MYQISESAKARFLSGQKQIASLTVVNDGYEPYAGETYNTKFKTNVVWNQMLKNPHFVNGNYWSVNTVYGTASVANNKLTYTITTKNANQSFTQPSISFIQNHIYLVSCWLTVPQDQVVGVYTGNSVTNIANVKANVRTRIFNIFKSNVTSTRTFYIYPARNSGLNVGSVVTLEDANLFDLTEMFGEGKEMLGRFSFLYNFTNNYYDYDVSGDSVPFTIPVYGGSLNVNTGVLSIDRYNVDLGYLYWQYSSAQASSGKYRKACTEAIFEPVSPTSTVPDLVSSGYVAQSNDESYRCAEGVAIASNASGTIYIFDERYTAQNDMPDFANAVRGVTVCYKMFSPVTFQLSPTEVRTLLGYNNIWSDTGTVNLSYRNTSGEVVAKSGDMVSIDDGAKNIPLASLSLPLLPKQDLHGYDYPWVGGGNKNLWDEQWVNGYFNTNGTWDSGNSWISSKNPISVEPDTLYFVRHSTDSSVRLYTTYWTEAVPSGVSDTTHIISRSTGNANASWLRTPANCHAIHFNMSASYGNVYNNDIIISLTQVDAYSPYENICPITGYTEANVTRTGKNLFDLNYLTASGITIADGVVSGTASAFNSAFGTNAGGVPNVKIPSGKITLSCDAYTGGEQEASTDNGLWFGFHYTNGTTNCIKFKNNTTSWAHDSVTSNEALTVDFIIVTFANKPNNIWHLKNIQLQSEAQTVANLVITEDKIIEGGLSVNRYCTTGKAVMVGSVVAGEMNAVLNNEDGAFNDVNFIGKDIKVEVGTMDGDTPDYIPLGYFQVDDSPKKLAHISLTTLDRMMLLEKDIDETKLEFPMTVNSLFATICNECGVTPASGQTLLNGDYEIEAYPENVQTYRDLLSCIAEISGTCAYFDWNGELRLEWFNPTPAVELNTHNRTSSDLSEESVIITGVEVKASDGDYLAGDDGFLLTVAQNPLITHDYQSVADSLYNARGNFGYRPFTANTLPMPYLYPLDTATFVDRNGNESVVAITDWTFRLNRNTDLRGRGESTLQASFKKKYGLTEGGVSIDEAIGLLRETIIKNAEIVNQSMEELSRTLHGEYEAISSEFGTYRNETDAKITANAEGITQAYSNIEEIDSKYGVAVNDTNQAVLALGDGAVATNTKFRELTEAYIKSGKLYYEGATPVYGVAVGQLTYEMVGGEQLIKRSGVYSVFTSEELAFYIDDVKVAYMRNKKLYINEAEFVSSVKIGRFTLEDGANGFKIK